MIKTYITLLLTSAALATAFLYGIDSELARRDYLEHGSAGNKCMFDSVCAKYKGE